jgi:superfamily II DNA or RNA helicase
LVAAIDRAKAEIERIHAPTGFNIGINIGTSAGQTIFHLHVHLIPRYGGDVADPRGGVRYVIPSKANYLLRVEDSPPKLAPSADRYLWTGGQSEPFNNQLMEHFATAARADIAVAFVMKSGVDLLRPAIVEALNRGTHIRLLTGDYLDATDPAALIQLLDFESRVGTIALRVYQTRSTRSSVSHLPTAFHPKAYLFEHRDGAGTAFIGSSNLSKSALTEGIEWNYRIVSSRDGPGYQEARRAFDELFASQSTVPLTEEWIEDYKSRRIRNAWPLTEDGLTTPPPETAEIPKPHEIQMEALAALRRSREEGAEAGLVVLATGLGKTWLSAFDSSDFKRVLFVAHREEILDQAMQTFRRIRPSDYLGQYNGDSKHPNAKVLFASIQTLSRQAHLDRFGADHFDYIVVDEFHHASATTYRRLLRHFRPRFLLGLTATPERSDGADLLELCGGNLVYRCDLSEGIRKQLLCTFDYFGVPDEVDYANIPWRSTRFNEEELTAAVATVSRAENALEQLVSRGGKRTLAFCVSQRHANFMARFFLSKGKRAVAVHAGADSAPRTLSLERLQAGELDVVCAVDMFNEGVDMPDLDTVMMLRPTESRILWLQQFGRGLRRSNPDKRLKVIDYIGNHRTFLLKPQTLFNLPFGDRNIQNLLERLRAGTAEMPPGCSVTYDLKAVDILKGLLRVPPSDSDALNTYVKDFIGTHGIRPTALEAYRDGYAPRSVRRNYGSWFGFLQSIDALDSDETKAAGACSTFLKLLESTPMTRSFKMLTLLGMLNADRFPGAIDISDLVAEVRRLGHSQSKIATDFGEDFGDDARLRASLETNPIDAWVGGAGTSGERFFEYVSGSFRTKLDIPHSARAATQSLARELAEWRLAEYFDRSTAPQPGHFLIKVNQSNGNPILMPLERERHPSLPEGPTSFIANGQRYIGNFASIALNTARKEGSDRNELPGILRTWFGPDAGAPGTRHQVDLSFSDGNWTLSPSGVGIVAPVLWKPYSREQIPGLFGLEFNAPVWQQGFIRRGDKTFLLVTLDKSAAAVEHKYQDRFVSASEFDWQSQNRTSQKNKDGTSIRDHGILGIEVLLFVRTHSKTKQNKASPFFYCGTIDFQHWHGEKPITVRWKLREEVPARLREELRVPT